MAGLPSPSEAFGNLNAEWAAECGFENRLMRVSGALTVDIIGFGWPVIGCRAITTFRNLAITDMNGITIFPNFKIFAVAFNQLVKVPAYKYFAALPRLYVIKVQSTGIFVEDKFSQTNRCNAPKHLIDN